MDAGDTTILWECKEIGSYLSLFRLQGTNQRFCDDIY